MKTFTTTLVITYTIADENDQQEPLVIDAVTRDGKDITDDFSDSGDGACQWPLANVKMVGEDSLWIECSATLALQLSLD